MVPSSITTISPRDGGYDGLRHDQSDRKPKCHLHHRQQRLTGADSDRHATSRDLGHSCGGFLDHDHSQHARGDLCGTSTFVVRFAPTAVGLRQATLSIANNDTSRNPFVFAIQGTGANPEIAIEEPVGTGIVNGEARSFGGIVLGQSSVLTFNVKNVGVSDLTGVALSVVAGNDADFTLSNLSTSTFAAGRARRLPSPLLR